MSLKVFTGENAPEVKEIDWLVENFLARGAGTIMFGQPGVSKTAHAAVLTASLCLGLPFAGLAVKRKCRVLYLDIDAGWNWARPLFEAAFRGLGQNGMPASFLYWSPLTLECMEDGKSTTFPTLEGSGDKITSTVKEHSIDLVVVDSLGLFLMGDSNSAQDVSTALRKGLNDARAAGVAVLVVDHATKGARVNGELVPTPAGSQQKRAWARVTVALEEDKDGMTRWTVDKTNARKFEPFLTRLDFRENRDGKLETLHLELIGEAGPRTAGVSLQEQEEKRIMALLAEKGEVRKKDLGDGSTFQRALESLLKSGKVVRLSRGIYRLADTSFITSSLGNEMMKESKQTLSPDFDPPKHRSEASDSKIIHDCPDTLPRPVALKANGRNGEVKPTPRKV